MSLFSGAQSYRFPRTSCCHYWGWICYCVSCYGGASCCAACDYVHGVHVNDCVSVNAFAFVTTMMPEISGFFPCND